MGVYIRTPNNGGYYGLLIQHPKNKGCLFNLSWRESMLSTNGKWFTMGIYGHIYWRVTIGRVSFYFRRLGL